MTEFIVKVALMGLAEREDAQVPKGANAKRNDHGQEGSGCLEHQMDGGGENGGT